MSNAFILTNKFWQASYLATYKSQYRWIHFVHSENEKKVLHQLENQVQDLYSINSSTHWM